MKQMVVNIMPEESRMAITRDGNLLDLAMERQDNEHIVNHIYKASVRNILPGMQAAFVDIGREQNAYLNLRQGQQIKKLGKIFEGQSMLVQVVKEEMGKKSAKVTADISLPGRYMVLLPYAEGVRISKKITDSSVRNRMFEMAGPYLEKGGGFILRTAAQGATEEELVQDMNYLWQTWIQIRNRCKIAQPGTELYKDADFALRLVRDFFAEDIDEIIVDDRAFYQRIKDLLQYGMHKDKVTYYDEKEPIFRRFGIESAIDELAQSEVKLPSGGNIRIDCTEALTVIDVNSGHFTGHSQDISDMAVSVNREATEEICRQLRLRDIGGVIIIDYIDMEKEEQKNEIIAFLKEEVKHDRVRVVVCDITALGLVEMTRKRERQGIQDILFAPCSLCGGTGLLLSSQTIYLQILRRLRELYKLQRLKGDILIEVHGDVKTYFTKSVIASLSEELKRKITVEIGDGLNREGYSILSVD